MMVLSLAVAFQAAIPTVQADGVAVIGALPSNSGSTSAVWGDGKAYIFGGSSGGGVESAEIVQFTPNGQSGSSSVVATLPTVRRQTSAMWANGAAYVAGGLSSGLALSDLVRWSPSGGSSVFNPLSPARRETSAAFDGNYLYVIGGNSGNDGSNNFLTQILRINPATPGSGTHAADLPSARANTAAAFDGTDVYIFGGRTSTGSLNEIVRFRPSDSTVTVMSAVLPAARFGSAAVWDGTRFLVFGGLVNGEASSSIVIYDPVTNQASSAPVSLAGRRFHVSAAFGGTFSYVFGGVNEFSIYTSDIQRHHTAPLAPRSLSAARGTQPGEIRLSWQAPIGPAPENYKIYRGTTSGGQDPSPIATVAAINFTDTGRTTGQVYFYKVSGVIVSDESPRSNEASARPPDPPGPPRNLAVARGSQAGQLVLTWQLPSDDGGIPVSGYHVWRGTTSGGESPIGGVVTATTYTDTGLPQGQTFYYKVDALNLVGTGPLSNEAFARTHDVPTEPQSFTATRGTSRGTIDLAWTSPSDGGGFPIQRYTVYVSLTTGGPYTILAEPTSTTFTHSGLPNNAQRYYRVSASNSLGEGPQAPERNARAPDVPSAPLSVATSRGPDRGEITVSWSAPSSDGGLPILTYSVYWGTVSGVLPNREDVGTATTWTHSGLPDGAVRYYRVSATNDAGEGPRTNEVSGRAPEAPTPPRNVAAASGNLGALTVRWDAPLDNGGMPVTKYLVYRTTVQGGETTVEEEAGSSRMHNDTNRLPGVRYYYTVVAVNGVGPSPVSAEASARGAVLSTGPAVPVVDPYDRDGDLVPTTVETRVCGTSALVTLLNTPGVPGACMTPTDYEPLQDIDDDDDLLEDTLVEAELCQLESANDPSDGICVGDDYGWPP